MKIRAVVSVLSIGVLALAGPVVAQTPAQTPGGAQAPLPPPANTMADEPRVLTIGMPIVDTGFENGKGIAGQVWFKLLGSPRHNQFGVVADAGFVHFSGGTYTSFMPGLRYSPGRSFPLKFIGQVTPDGSVLLAVHHCCNKAYVDPAAGIGVSVALKPMFVIRLEATRIFGDFDSTRYFGGISVPIRK